MKSSLSILMLTLVAGYTFAALGALVGFLPSSAFLGTEFACFVYAVAGLACISLNDSGHRSSLGHFA